MKSFQNLVIGLCLLFGPLFISGCDEDDPVRENAPELITKVTLTFVPDEGGTPIVVTATDPDGEGVQDMVVDGTLALAANTEYTLAISLTNELVHQSDPLHDITAEILEESDEHIFFFGWTDGLFASPEGDGNLDNRSDPVNYEDADINSLPIGIVTSWTTGIGGSGTFRILMKHQPGLKTETSTASMGETDLDIEFPISIF